MSKRQLRDKRIIITGASSGIGRELARQLYEQGAQLVITARRAERLEDLINAIETPGRKIIAVAGDVTDADLRQRLVDTSISELGGLDILINNAGVGAIGPFAKADGDRLRHVMEVNFFAPLEICRLAIPALRSGNQPMIVNIGSVLGHFAMPGKSEYCASKFALHGFTDALRAELKSKDIDVLLVSPSTTDSEFFEQVIDKPTGKTPVWGPFKMTPEKVASRIVKAIRGGRREIILSLTGKLAVWFDRAFPWLMGWIVSRK